MSRWIRMGYPPKWAILLACGLNAILTLAAIAVWSVVGIHVPETIAKTTMLLNVICGIGLAIFRIARYPSMGYRTWLTQTPWVSEKQRVPFGVWYPIGFDVIPLGLLGLLSALHVSWSGVASGGDHFGALVIAMALPPVAFIAFWSLGAFLIAREKWTWSIPCVVAWLGVFSYLGSRPELTQAAIGYVLVSIPTAFFASWHGARQVLKSINDKYNEPAEAELATAAHAKEARNGAWDVLSPSYRPLVGWGPIAERYRSVRGALALAAIAALYASIPHYDKWALALWFIVTPFAGIGALFIFWNTIGSHLSLPARWARREFIVPAYDRVWLMPLQISGPGMAILLAGFCGFINPNIAAPLGAATTVFLSLRVHPDHREWSLTVPCRYYLGVKPQPKKVA